MKKYISIILAVIIAFSMSVVAFAKVVYKGDANGDGEITALDARETLQFAADIKKPTSDDIKIVDMNGDGKITALDARAVLQAAAGLVEWETVPGVSVGEGDGDGSIDWGDIGQVPGK